MDPHTRERLGRLFAGWFFDIANPSRMIDFSRGDDPARARPLRVREVEAARPQLETVTRCDGSTIWSRIGQHRERFASASHVIFGLPAWATEPDPLLIDGTHRACAIYLLDPPHVELDLLLLAPNPEAPDIRAIRLTGAQTGAQGP